MKILKSILFRSLCAIAIGAMLVKYPEEGRTAFIQVIGALFLVSGMISVASYFYQRRAARNDVGLNPETFPIQSPLPPFAGVGSLVFGLLLMLVPSTLVEFISIIFGAMILVGAFNQFFSLLAARKYAPVPVFYWLFSSIIFIIGLVVILKPQAIADLVIQICGWCFIVYAVQDLLIGARMALVKRKFMHNSSNASALDDVAETMDLHPGES